MLSVACSENSVGRIQKVPNRAAFAHELGVIANGKILAAFLTTFFFEYGEHHSFRGSSQHRAAQNKNVRRFFLADYRGDLASNVLDVAEIEFAIFQAGRSDADERDLGIQHGCGRIGGCMQQAGSVRLGDHFTHASFDDRGAARVHHLNFGMAHIDADDLVAHGRETGSRNGTDVSQPKNANGQTQANSPGKRVSGGYCVALGTIPIPVSTVASHSPSEGGAASNKNNNLFSFNMLQNIFKMCADFEQAEAKSGQLFPPGGTTMGQIIHQANRTATMNPHS
jgi:hypothetical protein